MALAGTITLPSCSKKKQSKKEISQKRQKAEPIVVEQHPANNKKIDNLTHDEALKVYAYYKKQGKKSQTAQTIERIMALSTDHELIDSLLMELADIEFELENYSKAAEHYTQHALLYPGGTNLRYVIKQNIEALFKQILEPHRDQTKTKETIQAIKKFITTFPDDTEFVPRITFILETCYMNLLEHELNQVLFYMNRYNLTQQQKTLDAAWLRLTYLNREILPYITNKNLKNASELIDQAQKDETLKKDSATLERLVAPLQKALKQKEYDALPANKRNFLSRF